MKRIALVLCLVVLSFQSSEALIKFGGGVQGGVSFSSFPEPLDEFYGTGFGGGAHANLQIMKFFTLRLNGDYFSFSADKDKLKQLFIAQVPGLTQQASVTGGNASIIGITLDGIGRLPMGGPVTPYALAGLGFNFMSVSDIEVNDPTAGSGKVETDSETEFGLNFGAGAEFRLAALTIYLEVKYVLIFTETNSTSHIPIMIGITLP
ncbi:MAG: outer membrane beta-barrel protein [Bacteroidota bacterium]